MVLDATTRQATRRKPHTNRSAEQADRLGKPGATFKCGTCSEQMSAVDFWKLHDDKYSYKYEEEDPLEW